MPFDRNQVSHAEHDRPVGRTSLPAKTIPDPRRCTPPMCGSWARALQNLLANVFADADHPARRSIHALRNPPAPFAQPARSPAQSRKHRVRAPIPHTAVPVLQLSSMAAWPHGRGACAWIRSIRCERCSSRTLPTIRAKTKAPSRRKSEPSGQRKVAEPIHQASQILGRPKSPSINRLHGKHRVPHPGSGKPVHGLGNEATGRIIRSVG